jgi:hypothetical protein
MSDIMNHTRDDLVELPADCAQPADYVPNGILADTKRDYGPSFYLTLRPRSFAEAVKDVSRVRDLPDWIFEELHRRRHTAEVISLAKYRAAK